MFVALLAGFGVFLLRSTGLPELLFSCFVAATRSLAKGFADGHGIT